MTATRLRPANGPLSVVRWLRLDRRVVKHRYYRRQNDAGRFLTRLRLGGWSAELYVSSTTWKREA